MYEANMNFEAENELIENLANAGLKSLVAATISGIITNIAEKNAYVTGFLAAVSACTDATTSIEVLKKMRGEEQSSPSPSGAKILPHGNKKINPKFIVRLHKFDPKILCNMSIVV